LKIKFSYNIIVKIVKSNFLLSSIYVEILQKTHQIKTISQVPNIEHAQVSQIIKHKLIRWGVGKTRWLSMKIHWNFDKTFPINDPHSCDITIHIQHLVIWQDMNLCREYLLNIVQKTYLPLEIYLYFKVISNGNPPIIACQRNIFTLKGI
jgi:hypothetical protein